MLGHWSGGKAIRALTLQEDLGFGDPNAFPFWQRELPFEACDLVAGFTLKVGMRMDVRGIGASLAFGVMHHAISRGERVQYAVVLEAFEQAVHRRLVHAVRHHVQHGFG